MEQDLGELALGPEAFRAAQFVDTRPLAGDEPSKRTACYEALQDGGELDAVNDKSSYLRFYVASRLVNARLSGDMNLSVEDIFRNAVDHGHPQLAEEAHSALTSYNSLSDKAGRQEPEQGLSHFLIIGISWICRTQTGSMNRLLSKPDNVWHCMQGLHWLSQMSLAARQLSVLGWRC